MSGTKTTHRYHQKLWSVERAHGENDLVPGLDRVEGAGRLISEYNASGLRVAIVAFGKLYPRHRGPMQDVEVVAFLGLSVKAVVARTSSETTV